MNKTTEAFNIVDLFFDAAKKNPQRAALIYNQRKISFIELEQQIKDTAHYFISKEIGKNDRVLVFVPMSIDLYRIVLALFRVGAVAVFLDEWVSKKRMEECCKIAQCTAFIATFKVRLLSLFSAELRKIPTRLGTNYNITNSNTAFANTSREDTALITFTTGSSGTPKAALRTHGFLYYQFEALKEKIKPGENDISMVSLPIVVLINLATGTTSVIARFKAARAHNPQSKKIIQQIRTYSVNCIISSPFFLKKISEYINQTRILIPGMKKIFTGGAPVFPAEAAIYDKAFPGAEIEVVYGSTEAEPISSINIKTLLQEKENLLHGLSVGKIADCAEVKIIQIFDGIISLETENQLKEIELPLKETGEIIVSGDHVLRSYYNNEEAFKRNKIFIKNKCWHRTGDSGYLSKNGVLSLMGRCDTLIKKGNKIMYPFIYENYFQTIPGVETGTIILIKEKILVVIEPKKNAGKDSIKNNIEKFSDQFDKIIFMEKLPRDARHNSKIDYGKLRLLLANDKNSVT